MKSTLMISDLSVSKELDREELAAVRGGTSKNYDDNPVVGFCGTGAGGPVIPDLFPPIMLPFPPSSQPAPQVMQPRVFPV